MTDTALVADAPDPAVVAAQAEVDAVTRDEAGRFAAKAAADAPATPAETVYTLALPKDSKLDTAIVERTAADARELGLSNEAGQKLLDQRVAAIATEQLAAEQAVDAWKPNGTEWVKRDAEFQAAALADKDIGGSKEKLDASVLLAKQALGKYGSEDFSKLLTETGYGSHPAVIKVLANIGKAMGEPNNILSGNREESKAPLAERMYGADGTGAKKAE